MTTLSSHHKPGGGFRNPWGADDQHGLGSVVIWMAQRVARRVAGRTAPEPDSASFPHDVPRIDQPRAARQLLRASWVGHSTFFIQVGGLNILTDPMWGTRASPVSFAGPRRWLPPGIRLDALPPIDIVLQSHNHYDHLDRGTVHWLARHHPDARWLVPLGLASLVSRLGVRDVAELDWWDTATVGEAVVACTPARHFSARGLGDRDETLWCGWCVRIANRRIFFAGDTALHPEFATIAQRHGPFDLMMLPIGAYEPRWFMKPVHMTPEEAAEACLVMRAVQPLGHRSVMAAMHWGTFKLTDEPMDEPPRRMRAAWSRHALPVDDLWIPMHGQTREIP